MDNEENKVEATEESAISPKALFVGTAFYLVLQAVAVLVFLRMALGEDPRTIAPDRLQEKLDGNGLWLIFEVVVDPLLILASGYMCGLYARFRAVHHGFLMGVVISMASVVCFGALAQPGNSSSPIRDLVLFLLVIPMASAGGYLAERHMNLTKVDPAQPKPQS